jgi:hypothetical protein
MQLITNQSALDRAIQGEYGAYRIPRGARFSAGVKLGSGIYVMGRNYIELSNELDAERLASALIAERAYKLSKKGVKRLTLEGGKIVVGGASK